MSPPPAEAAAIEVPLGISPLETLLLKGKLRATLAMLGPAFVAAIAYVDPGNFATNVQGGARFGYLLLWVVLAANADGDADPVPLGQARHRHRPQPAGALPRALPETGLAGACGCRPR